VPTYQYACTDCGEQREVVQKFTEDPLTECPDCHGRLRKVFSAVGVVFKGSGFYRTDSRNAGSSSSTERKPGEKTSASTSEASSGTGDSSGSSAGSSGGESKPAGGGSGSAKDSGSSSSGSASSAA
jgi:putative FmdB family regulatory protein